MQGSLQLSPGLAINTWATHSLDRVFRSDMYRNRPWVPRSSYLASTELQTCLANRMKLNIPRRNKSSPILKVFSMLRYIIQLRLFEIHF
jgi:hypothetical protein